MPLRQLSAPEKHDAVTLVRDDPGVLASLVNFLARAGADAASDPAVLLGDALLAGLRSRARGRQ